MPSRYDKKFPDEKRGRSPEEIPSPPPWVNPARHDRLLYSADQRRWGRCLSLREAKLAEAHWREEWKDSIPDINEMQNVSDPAEVDRFLVRPSSTVELWNASARDPKLSEDAAHAAKLGFPVFAFDPALPDDQVRARFDVFLKKIRADRPITLRRSGPGKPSGALSISNKHLRRWRNHRILLLFDLHLHGYEPDAGRKTVAAWMFPEIEDELRRGNKLDEARRLLSEARTNIRVLWAQARG